MSEAPFDSANMRASDADREQVARLLHTAMAEGRLTAEELEQRLDAVYASETFAELEPLTSDLRYGGAASAAQRRISRRQDLIGGTPGPGSSIAVMSGVERRGEWVGLGVMGGFEDRTSTDAAPNAPAVSIGGLAIMGGVSVKHPGRRAAQRGELEA